MTGPLWQPSEDLIRDANLTRFMAVVKECWGVDAAGDFAELHRWSVTDKQEFWRSVWDLGGVVAARRQLPGSSGQKTPYRNSESPLELSIRPSSSKSCFSTLLAAGRIEAPGPTV